MEFDSDPDHESLRRAVRALVGRFGPRATPGTASAPSSTRRSPTAAGSGWRIPERYGGGAGITEAALLLQEIAESGAAMNGCSAVHLTIFEMGRSRSPREVR